MSITQWMARRWLELRVRITVIFGAIMLITYIYSGVTIYQTLVVDLPGEMETEIRGELLTLRGQLEQAIQDGQPPAVALEVLLQRWHGGSSVRFYDQEGQLRFATTELTMNRGLVDAALQGGTGQAVLTLTGDSNRRYLALSQAVRRENRVVGVLELDDSLWQIDRLYALLQPRVLMGLTVSLATILAAGVFLTRNVTRILDETDQAARRISQGDFSYRIRINSNDEVGRLVRTINSMAEELQLLSEARAQFLSKISHELRTPLTIIKGFCVTLLRRPWPADSERPLRIIEAQTDHLTRLVTDLLQLSRLDGGRLDLRLGEVDLAVLSQQTLEGMRLRAKEGRLEMEFDSEVDQAVALVDAQRIQQVLFNLLDNALKHTPPSGHVNLRLSCDDGWISISVEDSGAGIPADRLPFVFDRFYQVDTGTTGAGLGLAVVKELVEAHDGTVGVVSEMGKGSVFTVRLRQAKGNAAMSPEREE